MSTPAPITPINQAAQRKQTNGELVAARASLKADAEQIAESIAQIDAQLLERLKTVGTHDVDGTKVEIREYSRTDYAAIAEKFPAAEYPQLYTTTTAIVADAVKKQFAPAALEAYKVRGAKSVIVK